MTGFTTTDLLIILILVFALSLIALFLELLYVLWYRHRFAIAAASDLELANNGTSTDPKELLLYSLCFGNGTQPTGLTSEDLIAQQETPSVESSAVEYRRDEFEKWQRSVNYGQSSFLFTIREEEDFGVESDVATTVSGRTAASVIVPEDEEEVERETPYSTPCPSPDYYTPTSSPLHVAVEGDYNL